MSIKNVMEAVVQDVLKNSQKQLNLVCDCNRCMDDILATALNNLPPRYIVNPDHQPYVRAVHETDRDGAINILRVVTQAATLVGKRPRCESFNGK